MRSPVPPSGQSRFAWLLVALAGAAGAALLFFFDPATCPFYPPCPLQALAGLECPACGTLRAIHLLLHGRFRPAFAMNPLLFAALPVALVLLLRPVRARWLPWAALAILLAWFLFRNWPAALPW